MKTIVKLAALDAMLKALPVDPDELREKISSLAEEATAGEPAPEEPEKSTAVQLSLPFGTDEITLTWDWADLNPANPNDAPNLNLTIATLVLASNIETTVGDHAWSLVENSLSRLGFTNIVHYFFEQDEWINHAAMVFARSVEMVSGKYVVAAVYRGSSSIADFISDLKAEPGGFHDAGTNGVNMLSSYISSQGLSKENTILLITGHSYGAANSSLVGIRGTDLAERDSIFCYSFATPNYIRHGLTGEGMKMFSFDSNEDVVPQVPVGPNLDKTGVDVKFDRLDIQLNDPERYARFQRLYRHFRRRDFDEDADFLPEEYSFKVPIRIPVNIPIIRNHMPYTYMALILSALTDEEIDGYIGTFSGQEVDLVIEMSVGEIYKLPALGKGEKGPALLSWSSSDESVASLRGISLLEAKSAGSATLTASSLSGRQTTVGVHVSAD